METGAAGKRWLRGYLGSPPAKPFIFLCKNDITDLMPELSPSSCRGLKQRHLRATRILGWGRHQLLLQQDTACSKHFCTSFALEKEFHSAFCAAGTKISCWEGTSKSREKETQRGPSCSPQCPERRVESGSGSHRTRDRTRRNSLKLCHGGLRWILGKIS